MRLLHTRIGSTLFVHDDSTTDHVKQKYLVPDGHAAHYQDGSEEWIIDEVVYDPTQEGSAQYKWDKTGNRAKHARVRYTKTKQGKVTRKVESVIYKVI